MRFRLYRKSLADSMNTTRNIRTKDELLKFIQEEYPDVSSEDITFEYEGFDSRIGWFTYYVLIKHDGETYLIGMSDEVMV